MAIKQKILKPAVVTKFNIPCAFNGQASEVAVFIGSPEPKNNPIHFQSKFIQEVRGGVIPKSVFESLEKLQKLAIENGVPFAELCTYALSSLQTETQSNDKQIPANTDAADSPPEDEHPEEQDVDDEDTEDNSDDDEDSKYKDPEASS